MVRARYGPYGRAPGRERSDPPDDRPIRPDTPDRKVDATVTVPLSRAGAPPRPAARTGSPRRAWSILGLLAAFSVINFGDKAVVGLAGPSITRDLHLSNTRFGVISSAFYLLFSLAALLVGLLGDRFPPGRLLVAMALLWSAAQLPILVPAAGFGTLIVTRVMLGAGEGPSLPMANHVAFTWFPRHRRTTTAGVVTLGGALGVIVGGPVLAAVISLAGWRWAFGLLGALGLIWTAAWLRFGGTGPYSASPIESEPGEESEAGPEAGTGPAIAVHRILLTPTWLAAAFAGFTGNWVLGLGLSWLPTFLEHRTGYPATTVGFLIGLPSVVAVISVPTVMYLAHRRRRAGRSSRSTYAVLGFGSAAVPAAGLASITLGERGPLLVLAVAIAFGAGVALAPLVTSAVADLVPVERRGLALCTGTAVSSLGAVASPWATGRLLDLAGSEAAGFDAAFRLSAGLALLGGACLLFLDPEKDGARLRRR
jgi:MFS family permease